MARSLFLPLARGGEKLGLVNYRYMFYGDRRLAMIGVNRRHEDDVQALPLLVITHFASSTSHPCIFGSPSTPINVNQQSSKSVDSPHKNI